MLTELVTRLTDVATTLVDVQVAEDLDALARGTAVVSGTAFVVPWRERAKPNQRQTGGHLQQLEVQFVIAFLVRFHGDAKGGERAALFDGYKRDVENALAGWTPDETNDPFELIGGELSPLGNGTSIFAQTWETTRILTGGAS